MIATAESASDASRGIERLARWAPALLITAGLAVRLISAYSKFLNADEAMHYLLSVQPSFAETYRASLGTAHPPLLIILLHYWGMISRTEFFLRLPSVLAGTAAGWFLYAWLRDRADRATATIALGLFVFSPALIYTSAEVRQYALLLCFMCATLYLQERALAKNSTAFMFASGLTLYLALLTHYCALIFAVSVAIYALLRMWTTRPGRLILAWIFVQLGGIAIGIFLWETHISIIRHRPLTQDVAESYLRNSLFHPGRENVFAFIARSNLRLFHFFFSQGAISVVGVVLFLAGIAMLFAARDVAGRVPRSGARSLGALLLLPFAINCAAAVAGLYPYGGTRHNAYLAVFAMPAVAIPIARWRPRWAWSKPIAVAAALAICNFAVNPAGAYIKPKNQKRKLLIEAVRYLRTSAPAGSVVLTDYESGLLLSYYLCDRDITHSGEPSGSFYLSQCGEYESASVLPRLWIFRAETFPTQVNELARSVHSAQQVWLFQAGFIVDREPGFQTLLGQYGCDRPRKFGANVIVCRINPGVQPAG
ncbi:MAG TPA: glycosyltransferase family 39 protein [Terriglobales bacterium]|nr:glycosyltransferase family 39 protein [Terriglobales bacterium]